MAKIEAFKTLEIKLQNVSVSAYDAIIELVISLGLYGDALIRPDRRCAKLYRSRWEGCEFCSKITDKGADAAGCLFCPVCGRPLKKEAWAALERRINGGTADNTIFLTREEAEETLKKREADNEKNDSDRL